MRGAGKLSLNWHYPAAALPRSGRKTRLFRCPIERQAAKRKQCGKSPNSYCVFKPLPPEEKRVAYWGRPPTHDSISGRPARLLIAYIQIFTTDCICLQFRHDEYLPRTDSGC